MNAQFWTHTVQILVMLAVAFALGLWLGYLLWNKRRPAQEQPVHRDDLKKIEGIGPKIEKLFNTAGIYNWQQLAQTPVSRLQKILDDAGPDFRVAVPATWPRQAEMAAAGNWAELKKYQDVLQGGREPGQS